ncbi:MAG TPA: ATP-binding cassette domain-containing protein [Myxococcota bacterium]|jgi:ATP-binding cassette subfamily F protein uup
MPLLSFEDVSIAFGLETLLERASFQIDAGERACLIGRNGAGKSTLLKLVEGELTPDGGKIWRQPGLRIARLSQELPEAGGATVFDMVAEGVAGVGRLLAEYHRVSHDVGADPSLLRRLEQLQHELEAQDGWSLNQRVDDVLARLGLSADARLGELSGGWRRRVALARALVGAPDLLLLDEPTNHLDVEVIEWLEEQLLALRGAVLFVTHDRTLLGRLATRILELDRGALTSWSGSYASFLEKKAAALEQEERRNALFDKKLAEEEIWIRRGIQARRTRNEGRVRALVALREERARRRERPGSARITVDEGQTSGKLVIDAEKLSYGWGGAPIVRDLSLRILRGDRIGLVGPNGAGKTTLLRLLLGELAPASGRVRLGTRLEIAYFDQLRAQLDLEKTVLENVAEGSEYIEIQGQRRHVIGYLQDFLFAPERTRSPVSSLSGGERNRLLLARLLAQPANLLVLDEPTNDLDVETLELLEEKLVEFSGTLLVVSHDRAFLDNVVTSALVFEGEGRVQEYVGGYTDAMRQSRAAQAAAARPAPPRGDPRETPSPPRPKPGRLGFAQQRELAALPAQIEALEAEQKQLLERAADPELYRRNASDQGRVHARLAELAAGLEAAYARWAALEAQKTA